VDVRDLHPDPLVQLARWLEEARAAGLELPEAMTLATADAQGIPSARMVLLKGVDERGCLFFTNTESRQAIPAGPVESLPRDESESYFRTRPLGSRLGAWSSHQSQPISSREVLDRAYAEAEERYGDDPPLPPWWGGYVLRPEAVELWQNRPNRLHDRFRYTREAHGGWRVERLAP
jgi:pyridoxamine 5'-phosphate oxidase